MSTDIYSSVIIRSLMASIALLMLSACVQNTKTGHPLPNNVVLKAPISKYLIIVPVTIEGKQYQFLLDTGASYTMIDNHLAKVLTVPTPELQIPGAFHQMFADGIRSMDGKLKKDDLPLWQPKPLALGGYIIWGTDPWLGHDFELVSQSTGMKIDGILGVEVFRQLSWLVDNKGKTLTILRQAPSTVDYQHCMPYSDHFAKSPELEVNFKPDYWVRLYVDTGASYTTVPPEFIKFLKENGNNVILASEHLPTASVSGLGSTNDYLIDNLYFNNMPIGRLNVSENSGENYNIGMNFLSRFDNYLFIPNKMQFCYNANHFTRYDKKPLRYIALRYFDGHIEVFYNKPDLIAKYGLENGDILLAINGKELIPAEIYEVREQLSNTPSGLLSVLIERKGRQKTLKF